MTATTLDPTASLVIIDLYGDGRTLRVARTTPALMDEIRAWIRHDGSEDVPPEERLTLDEWLSERGAEVFTTTRLSLPELETKG